jgi:hypothetical protein
VAVWALTITVAAPVRDRALAGGPDGRADGPDVIFHHGKIFTADPAAPTAQAVAIRRDRVVAVGTDEAVLTSAGETTRKVDLGGRTVIPGINDAHVHHDDVPFGGRIALDPSDRDPALAVVTEAVRRAAREAPPGASLYGAVGPSLIRNPSGVRDARRRRGRPSGPALRLYAEVRMTGRTGCFPGAIGAGGRRRSA